MLQIADTERVIEDVRHRNVIGQKELVVGEVVRTIERHSARRVYEVVPLR